MLVLCVGPHTLISCCTGAHAAGGQVSVARCSQQMLGLAGLFLGPQMVGEALKGGRLIARVMEAEGYRVHLPASPSFITAVEVGSRERMVAFCKAVQRASPVGSYIEPTPGDGPPLLTAISVPFTRVSFHPCILLEAAQSQPSSHAAERVCTRRNLYLQG